MKDKEVNEILLQQETLLNEKESIKKINADCIEKMKLYLIFHII